MWRGLILLALMGCGTEANHLGSPLTWAVSGPVTLVENTVYDARRRAVAGFLADHRDAVLADIDASGGPMLDAAYDLAQVPGAQRTQVTAQFQRDRALLTREPDALLISLMVSGG